MEEFPCDLSIQLNNVGNARRARPYTGNAFGQLAGPRWRCRHPNSIAPKKSILQMKKRPPSSGCKVLGPDLTKTFPVKVIAPPPRIVCGNPQSGIGRPPAAPAGDSNPNGFRPTLRRCRASRSCRHARRRRATPPTPNPSAGQSKSNALDSAGAAINKPNRFTVVFCRAERVGSNGGVTKDRRTISPHHRL
jgi:hypothetical protein